MSHHDLTIGFDLGSVSLNGVVLSANGSLLEELQYQRHFGKTLEVVFKTLESIESKYGRDAVSRVVFTGTHGEAVARETKTYFEIETTAQTRGLHSLMPDAKAVISIGGHDSALLMIAPAGEGFILNDFKLNEACAAGTGSFIDQQAERIFADLPQFHSIQDPQQRMEAILNHFVAEGKKSDQPANVACRCTVFTKSDMIHLQNKGIAIRHIIAGLHDGVAKNFKSTLISNRRLESPVAFIGGYASNSMAKNSFEKILGLKIQIPPHHTSVGALGVALIAGASGLGRSIRSDEIAGLKSSAAFAAATTEPLAVRLAPFAGCGEARGLPAGDGLVEVFMGLDIGSTTTKMVLISPQGDVYYKRYIPTEGQPVVAIKKCLRHLISSMQASRLKILGVGATGSGREVANLFVGADDVVNEVTAHARGTTFFKTDVDTIFELGGQDAKFTSLSGGFVVDFKMNKVCAAGTGSFLEETANKLGINIAGEYETLALASKAPYKLTERCTVFMESDLMSFMQMGAPREGLLAGLARAVVHNYLNRVVQDGKIGNSISFQGGPSLNKSIVAAFEAVVGKPIVTLPHREVMGAIGAGLHAHDEYENMSAQGKAHSSRFRGWKIVDAPFSHSEEICRRNPKCHNQCKLQVYRIGGDEAVYGGECGLFESRAQAEKRTPDFARIRQQLFFKAIEGKYRILGESASVGRHESKTPIDADADCVCGNNNRRPTLGIPRSLSFFQMGLFWVHLMENLGFDIVITPETDSSIVNMGIETMTCESCFPVKISHGHAKMLMGKVDYLFMPMMIEMEAPVGKKGYYCPYLEANTYMLKAALGFDSSRTIMPAIYMKTGATGIKETFAAEFRRLGLPFNSETFDTAYAAGQKARNRFEAELKRIGDSVIKNLGNKRAIIVAGRPYSAYDSRTNLNLFATFSRLGITAIPQEFLDLDNIRIDEDYPNMYWGFGDRILKVARFINGDARFFGLYLTSFACGPDSFILHFFNHEMNRTGRPYLELELDEHSAGAGVETRLLAFVDVIKNQKQIKILGKDVHIQPRKATAPLAGRTIYLPKMSDGSDCLAAAFEAVGSSAKVMNTYTEAGIEFGKSNTSGKECYPCTVTTGDMFNLLNELRAQKIDIENHVAFFMPETEGPCRFGQYNRLHRILLEKFGFGSIPILSPSSEDSYRCSGLFNDEQADEFRKLGWQAIVYSDIMEKALWRIRPYEKVKGTTDRVYSAAIQRGINAIHRGGGLKILKAAEKSAGEFTAIEIVGGKKPLIGIVGEIYLRTHKASNQRLINTLEDMGCETYTSSISEWIEYTTHTGIEDSQAVWQRQPSLNAFGEIAKFWLTDKYQRLVAWMIGRPFSRLINGRFDHTTAHILELVDGIFSNHINGEAILSIGGALSFQKDGFNGVVNALPFTCMPSTIASSILKVHLRGKVPYVDMVYDGTILPNRVTNIATFAFQAKQNLQNKALLNK